MKKIDVDFQSLNKEPDPNPYRYWYLRIRIQEAQKSTDPGAPKTVVKPK
jgi:hypothetical protein